MSHPFCDTDVIIRLITGDDPAKQARAIALFERVEAGALELSAPSTVIADAVFALTSPRLYALPRDEVAARLTTLVRLPGFQIHPRSVILRALQLYAAISRLDFGDAMIIAQMQETGEQTLFSYDADFDGIEGIARREP